ncbi:solute carrier family 22 member 1-like [Plodia interpunctella]|uniref:solute carrier family 22 member 1-like n=1 Tax=Plodia interpunctella TaxID=58824 RepID=UPI0023675E53|nr:solute carrier family 22 member 1-like [Plodia interpunctella]
MKMPEETTVKSANPIEQRFRKIRRYHYFFFFILFLSKLPLFWHFISLIFLSPRMDFYCDVNKGGKNYCPCENPRWDTSVFTKTIQTKFNLHCERQWLVTLTQSTVYIGTLFGSYGFGRWSDKWGRRSACVYSCLTLTVSGCLLSFMPGIVSFLIVRFIEGAACGGYVVVVFVFLVEFCGPNNREIVSVLFHIPPNFGHATLAAVSYLLRDCDYFQLAISVPLIIFVSMRCLLYESPKWLLDLGRLDEAADVMGKIDKFNKEPNPSMKPELEAFRASMTSNTKVTFWEIFKHKRLTINFVCMAYIYFVCGMGFYGVSQYIGHMSGDIHKNVALSGLLLIPGTCIALLLIKVLSRRQFLMLTSLISGVFIIIVVFLNEDLNLLKVIFACICNSGFYLSFLVAFLYGVELFPTSIRSSALGTLSTISRIGQIVAPQINTLSPFAAALTFGIMAIIGTALCIPLPETKNVELPSTVEDTKIQDKAKKVKHNVEGATSDQEAAPSK